jgi:hypothetical protein
MVNKLGLMATAAATAAAAASAALVRSNLKSIDSLAKTADKLGIATESLQGLRHAAELTGVSAGQMDTAIQRMTRRVSEAARGSGEAKDAIRELGLSAQDLAKMTPDQQMRQFAAAMSQVENQGDRVRLAMRLFDTEGVALVNTLGGGVDALDAMTAEVKELGAEITRVDAAKIEAANDAFTRAGMATSAFGKQMTIAVAPVLTQITNDLFSAAKEAGGFGQIATEAMDKVYKAAGHVGNAIRGFQIIFKGVELAGTVAFYGITTGMSEVQKFAARMGNSVIASVNMIIDGLNTLGADIQKIGQIEVGGGLLEGMAESFKQQAGEIATEIQNLAMAELPSDVIDRYVKSAVEAETLKGEAVAQARLEQRENQASTDEEETARQAEVAQMRIDAAKNYANYEKLIADQQNAAKSKAMDNLVGLMNSKSRKLFEIGKIAALSRATVSGMEEVQSAFQWGMSTGGPYLAAAFGAASAAGVAMRLQQIASAKFGGGGGSGAVSFNGRGQEVVRTETQVASINIVGGQGATFSGDQIRGLIGAINDAVGDGVQLRTN